MTQGQWELAGRLDYSHQRGDDRCPVEMVSWEDAQAFVRGLAERDGAGYRLPSEAEWEYAARAGTTGARYGDLDAVAWSADNSPGRTRPVGGKLPNPWGLYDMLGNVWEWCQDTWHDDYSGAPTDGSAWDAGHGLRVLRGGSWYEYGSRSRAASRGSFDPEPRANAHGLRVIALPTAR